MISFKAKAADGQPGGAVEPETPPKCDPCETSENAFLGKDRCRMPNCQLRKVGGQACCAPHRAQKDASFNDAKRQGDGALEAWSKLWDDPEAFEEMLGLRAVCVPEAVTMHLYLCACIEYRSRGSPGPGTPP